MRPRVGLHLDDSSKEETDRSGRIYPSSPPSSDLSYNNQMASSSSGYGGGGPYNRGPRDGAAAGNGMYGAYSGYGGGCCPKEDDKLYELLAIGLALFALIQALMPPPAKRRRKRDEAQVQPEAEAEVPMPMMEFIEESMMNFIDEPMMNLIDESMMSFIRPYYYNYYNYYHPVPVNSHHLGRRSKFGSMYA